MSSMRLEHGTYRNKPFAYLREHEPDWQDAEYLEKRWPKQFEYPRHFTHHEHGGGGWLLGKANYLSWIESFPSTQGKTWWDMGESGILVRLDLLTKDEREALEHLEDYPVMDDDHLSQLEQEELETQWDSWGRNEFRGEIRRKAEKVFDELIEKLPQGADEDPLITELGAIELLLTHAPEPLFDEATQRMYNKSGEYPTIENGDARYPFGDFVQDWDGRLESLAVWLGLGDLEPDDHPWLAEWLRAGPPMDVVHVELADTAYTTRKHGERTLRIKPKDLPERVRALATTQTSIVVPYDEEVCASLYLDCHWEFLMNLPPATSGASERTRIKRKASHDPRPRRLELPASDRLGCRARRRK